MKRASGAGGPPLEAKVTKSIVAYLKTRPEVWFFKVAGGPMQQRGVPDIICCVNGAFVALEVKRPELGRLTDLQALTIEQIRESGGVAEVVTSVEEAAAMLERLYAKWEHAKWEHAGGDGSVLVCSACQSVGRYETPRCAYCGAIMDCREAE